MFRFLRQDTAPLGILPEPARRSGGKRWRRRFPSNGFVMASLRRARETGPGRLIRLKTVSQESDCLQVETRAALKHGESLWLFFPPQGLDDAFERYGTVASCRLVGAPNEAPRYRLTIELQTRAA